MLEQRGQRTQNQETQKQQSLRGEEGFRNWEIGLEIAQRRRQMNMTQEELAEEAELSRQSICNIEQGKQKPSGQTLFCIFRALKLHLSVLNEGTAACEMERDSRLHVLEAKMSGLTEEDRLWLYETVSVLCDGIRYRDERTTQIKVDD